MNDTARVDALIVTAIRLEYNAVRQVDEGAVEGTAWEETSADNGLPLAFRTFRHAHGRPTRLCVALAGDMGPAAAINVALPLVEKYRPRCIAMAGVCAGRPGKTALGDVIAAERLYFHDAGKQLDDRVQQDLKTYNLRDDWKVAIEGFDFAGLFRDRPWFAARPIPYAWQESWVLAKLAESVTDPAGHPDCERHCPQWATVIASLWRSGDVLDGTLTLTEAGRARIGRTLIQHRNRLPDLSPTGTALPFRVHVAPMGSGNKVVEDEGVWGFVSTSMRKTLGIEMEAVALGAIAHSQRQYKLDALVMKAVMDFANHGRDDHFKEFAARASAECLIAFLRRHLEVPHGDGVLDEGTLPPPSRPAPSQLLDARYGVVPWREGGRGEVLAELDTWADSDQGASVRLLHAEGGVGKTRLAIEWTRRRRERGWIAGFLPKNAPDDWYSRLREQGAPSLVVIDYAESRLGLGLLLDRIRNAHVPGTSPRLRVLLLARNNGDWWTALAHDNAALRAWIGGVKPLDLGPVAVKAAERDAVFQEAARAFAAAQGKLVARRTPAALDDARFERVLYLHMAALAAVEGTSFEAGTLMEVTLDHEENFWREYGRSEVSSSRVLRHLGVARQAVAAATLRGGLPLEESARATVERLLSRGLREEEADVLMQLHYVYQRSDGGAFLPALEPDLLGEAMVLRVATPPQTAHRVADDWIERMFTADDESALRVGFTVLGRASATGPATMRPWITRLLSGPLTTRARLALEAAKVVGRRTVFTVLGEMLAEQLEARGDAGIAGELARVGIPYPTVSLVRVGVWVNRTLHDAIPEDVGEWALLTKANSLNERALRLGAVGRHEEALTAAQASVAQYRALSQRDDVYLRYVAQSLVNQGVVLGRLGRREEALTAVQEAVALQRALAQEDLDTFREDLAGGLNNLGNYLGALGRREEALTATEEAIAHYRVLAQRDRGKFLSRLATSLDNMGDNLGDLGRLAEALVVAQEAVALRRELVAINSDAHLPDLARSLSNLGNRLSALGRSDEALAATLEAVTLRRALAKHNPAFLPELANNLTNLGGDLGALGRTEEALAATQEAVKLYRSLEEGTPGAFLPELAAAVDNLGIVLSKLGHDKEALAATREAVTHRRALVERNRDAFLPGLANSLCNLGNRLHARGQGPEGLVATREGIALHRELERRNTEAFLPDLANYLISLGANLNDLGRRGEALEVTQEAVGAYRTLVQRNSNAFSPNFTAAAFNLASTLSDLKRPSDALLVLQEALDVIWPFFERSPHAFSQLTGAVLQEAFSIHTSLRRSPPPALLERRAAFGRLMRP